MEEAGDLQATAARARGGRDPAGRSHQHRRPAGPHRRARPRASSTACRTTGRHRGAGGAAAPACRTSWPGCAGTPTCRWPWASECRTAEQADEVAGYADGVIIGSSLVDVVARRATSGSSASRWTKVRASMQGCGRQRSVRDEYALFLEVVLERLRADAVEPGEVGEIILADGEQLLRRVVAQLAQEGEVGLERPALFGRKPVEEVEADAQGTLPLLSALWNSGSSSMSRIDMGDWP